MSQGGQSRAVARAVIAFSLSILAGCTGTIGDAASGGFARDGGPVDGARAFVCQTPGQITVGSSPVRRLTNVEYDNTVRDLFGGDIPTLPAQPTDAVLKGSFENDALSLGPSDVRIARYETAAESLGRHTYPRQLDRMKKGESSRERAEAQ